MPASQLHALFQDQLAKGEALIRILEKETEALSLRDAEAIERLAAEKQRLTGVLAEHAQSLAQLLTEQDPNGLNPGIGAAVDNEPALKALWEQTKSVLATAHTLNQVNGKTVELSLNHVARTLRILTTGTDKPQNQVYSASGRVDAGDKRSQRVVTV